MPALSHFKTGTYTRSRYTAGVYTDGVWVQGAATVTTVDASIQPLTGKDLEMLPEGWSTSTAMKVYTRGDIAVDDILTVDSESWRVITKMSYPGHSGLLGHTKAIIARVDQP